MKTDVVSFGEVLWDLFDMGDGSFLRTLGGSSANIATALARLGVRTKMVGAVGNDVFGEAIRAHLEKDGVDVRSLVSLDARTGVTFITRDAEGEPAFLNYREGAADGAFPKAKLRQDDLSASWLVIGTSGVLRGTVSGACYELLNRALESRVPVAADLNARPALFPTQTVARRAMSFLLARGALVKVSARDLRSIAKTEDAALTWVERHRRPGSCLVLTRGADGATAFGAHGTVTVPARKARCVDATGAGDAFFAGVLAALLAAGASPSAASWADPDVWKRALEVGHMLGARAVGEVGATTGLGDLDRARGALAENPY